MEVEKEISLTGWYVQREKQNVATHPEQKEKFLDILKNRPELVLDYIKRNFDSIAMTAAMSGQLSGVFIYDENAQIKEILDALKKAFLNEDASTTN